MQTFGTHEAAVRQSQIASASLVFGPLITGTPPAQNAVPSARYEHGTHRAAVEQSQIATASVVFHATGQLPQFPFFGLARDIVITQEEWPWSPGSYFFNRTAYLASGGVQNPVGRPAVQTLPQYPLDQQWSFIYQPPTAAAVAPTAKPNPPFLVTYPQDFRDPAGPLFFQPPPAPAPTPQFLFPETLLDVQEFVTAAGQWTGEVQLSWAAIPGLTEYRVYVNGAAFLTTSARVITISDLQIGQQYTFAIVGMSAGIEATPLSNEINYEHGATEFAASFKYPWGNTPETGYVLKIPLGTKV